MAPYGEDKYERYDDDDWDEDDAEKDFWDRDEDDEPPIPCPHCGREVHEDAQRCPHCEKYLSAEDAPPERKPWWIYISVAVCLYLIYRSIVGWF